MSNNPVFLVRRAKKSSGLPDAVLWCSDDFESAVATLDYLLVKSGNKLSSYFKAVATHFPVVDDLPAEGEVDFAWCDRYQLGEDSMTWELKPGAVPADAHHNAREETTAPETTETNDIAQEDECQECETPVVRLPVMQRFLHINMFAADEPSRLHHATPEQRKHIIALEMDMDNARIQNLISGLRGLEFLDKLDNAGMLRLSENIKTAFPEDKKAEPVDYRNFAVIWNETRHPDRGLLAKEWGKGNRVTGINRTQSGANAGGGNKTDRPQDLKHDLDSLDKEIALATLPMDFNIYDIPGSIYRRAKEIVERKESPFKEWSAALRATPGILDYSRAAIFALIRGADENLHHFPDSLRTFISTSLKESDHENATPETLAAARHTAEVDGKEEYNRKEEAEPVPADNRPTPTELAYQEKLNALHEARNNLAARAPVSTDKGLAEPPGVSEEAQLRDAVSRQLAAERGEFVQGISDPDAENWVHDGKEAQPAAQQTVQETQPAASVSDVQKSLSERPESEQENLALWKNVFKTDERFTRAFAVNGGGTSINGTYMTMIATREFGPKGIGWGVDILEERFDDGAPLTRKNGDSQELITDGNGNFLTEKHHVIKIRLWYIRNGQRGQEVAYGCTPYITNSKYGVVSDGEAPKKSLTDATKKALSSLGFCADIFMGLYDNAEYRSRNKAEFDLKNASENAEDVARLRRELDERLTRVADTLSSAVSTNELKKVYDTIAREVDVHRKAADSKGDAEYAKYLGGRLRRLTQIKDQRMAALTGKEEQSA
ncbi:hypothetical protein AUM47_03225 [Cronobacter malonaticus]|uniref:RecE family exodeoxyribonuclease n=1 Tax=Cronobacter malonaticus TaxID=413503 RepID=UPI00067C1995|nr:RecE family exodeoxyribonuclease [Cronobacter malonaticus]EGT4370532.1 hypothetical protein [Cronobacter malonaticus]MDI6466659.1 hypothetical protein [Cronobacter malonaticus]HAU5448947.1 hypothetical protein [Cronobacter malonaticus]